MRMSTVYGSGSIFGSVQAGTGSLVQMAGGLLEYSLLYVPAGAIAKLTLPTGNAAVPGVIVIEASFTGTGNKEIYVDAIALTK